MLIFKIKDRPLVTMMAKSSFKTPYTTQRLTPNKRIANIMGETSSTFFVFQARISWGTTAEVVHMPANKPNRVIASIYQSYRPSILNFFENHPFNY